MNVIKEPNLVSPLRLKPSDRCDRCGVQAYVEVTMSTGLQLLFCGHHFRANEDKLVNAKAIHSELNVLEDTREVSCGEFTD